MLNSKLRRWFRPPLSSSRGFTLVELMIALLVFGIGIVALAQSLPNGVRVRDRARRMSVATNLAQQQVERLRALPENHADLAAGSHADPLNPIRGAYRRRWSIQDDTPISGMRRVVVTVSFTTASPDSEAILTTQIAR
jgi:type IV pilus assembly protein PilV